MMQNKENTNTEVKTNEEIKKEINEAVVRVLWNGMHMTYQEYKEAIEAERN